MPKIKTSEFYGSSDHDSRLMFRERLMKLFAAHDWVRVINVDKEPFVWQYLPQHAEDFEFTPDPMKITHRGEVEVYSLMPGESEVIVGENAYLMIEGLYKKVVARRVVAQTSNAAPGQARNFNWTDGQMQDDWIRKIYLGKENPMFGDSPVAPVSPIITPSEVKKNANKVSAAITAKPARMRKAS